jgi:antagonist of KipI
VIRVLRPGLLTTIQDLGRDGWAGVGVPRGGAADPRALRLGNRLVGNAGNAPALEMTLAGPTLLFERDAVAALSGADFGARLGARRADAWSSFAVRAGDVLECPGGPSMARGYLCVAGGVEAPVVLGGRSTCLPGRFGGHEGRALRAGDTLRLAPPPPDAAPRRIDPEFVRQLAPRGRLRVLPGPHLERFPPESLASLSSSGYRVSTQSNRVGVRLQGPPVRRLGTDEMPTEGMVAGAVQVPAGGEPIVLGVDCGTTGGYPVLASVITADLPELGQLRPGDAVRFGVVTLEDALEALRESERLLAAVPLVES